MSRLFRILVSAQAECWYRPVSGAVVPTAQNMPRCATKVKQSVCPSRNARSERSLRRRAISESTLLPREKQLNRRSKKSAELRTISSRCSFVSPFSHAKYFEIPPTNRDELCVRPVCRCWQVRQFVGSAQISCRHWLRRWTKYPGRPFVEEFLLPFWSRRNYLSERIAECRHLSPGLRIASRIRECPFRPPHP
jgi:hypothetical protein